MRVTAANPNAANAFLKWNNGFCRQLQINRKQLDFIGFFVLIW